MASLVRRRSEYIAEESNFAPPLRQNDPDLASPHSSRLILNFAQKQNRKSLHFKDGLQVDAPVPPKVCPLVSFSFLFLESRHNHDHFQKSLGSKSDSEDEFLSEEILQEEGNASFSLLSKRPSKQFSKHPLQANDYNSSEILPAVSEADESKQSGRTEPSQTPGDRHTDDMFINVIFFLFLFLFPNPSTNLSLIFLCRTNPRGFTSPHSMEPGTRAFRKTT